MNDLFMGIDIGTSSIRAALFRQNGELVAMSQKEYTLISTEPRMAELSPSVVFDAFCYVVSDCNKKMPGAKIAGAGISTQIHSLMAVDHQGECLTNLFTWADLRPLELIQKTLSGKEAFQVYERTGCKADHPMYPLSKVLWLKETRPDVFEQAQKLISIKSYILYRLFGEYVIDYTDASSTAMFDIHHFKWDEEILTGLLGISQSKLAEPVEITYTLSGMNQEFKNILGFSTDVPFTVGSGDGMLANLGSGVFDETKLSCTIGTSGAIRTAASQPVIDPAGRTWCYCFTKNTWVAGGAINNGGIVQKWFRDEFFEQFTEEAKKEGLKNPYQLFDYYAKTIPAGSDGLTFLPYLTGERSPGWHADASGMLCGLKLMHGKAHIAKAIMEGVMFNMYSIFQAVTSISSGEKTIMANGGYVNSEPWLQIQADIFNAHIHVSEVTETSVLGAAYTAMVAQGALADFNQPLPVMASNRVIAPIQENHDKYRIYYKNFINLYEKLIQNS